MSNRGSKPSTVARAAEIALAALILAAVVMAAAGYPMPLGVTAALAVAVGAGAAVRACFDPGPIPDDEALAVSMHIRGERCE